MKVPPNLTVEGDSWLIEIAYEQTAEYHPAMTFPPQQRVAFAAELFDNGGQKVSPQSRLQALATATTMTRLTIPPAVARFPVVSQDVSLGFGRRSGLECHRHFDCSFELGVSSFLQCVSESSIENFGTMPLFSSIRPCQVR